MAFELWRQFEGQTIEQKYQLQALLGVGGYGGVFLADHTVAGRVLRRVAVKLMAPDPENGDAQLHELVGATSLTHPHLLRCFDAGQCRVRNVEMLYLVMEVAATSLADEIQRRALSVDETRELAAGMVSALGYLHEHRYVHCDVKPANILQVGSTWKLSDFGLLRTLSSGTISRTRSLLGSAAYTPPEAYDGVISPAWDVWSLGVTLAEALMRRKPFTAATEAELQGIVQQGKPVLAGLPAPFDRIIAGCLQKDRRHRWTLPMIQEALTGAPGTTSARRAGVLSGAASISRRNLYALLAGLAVPPLVFLAILFVPKPHRSTPPVNYEEAPAHNNSRQSAPVQRRPEPTTPQDAPAEVTAASLSADQTRQFQGEIYALLDQWQDSLRNKNLEAQVACYAPQVRVFFTKRGLSQNEIRKEKQAAFDQFDQVRRYEVRNVSFDALTTDRAVISFDKAWDTVGATEFAGEERQRLTLRKLDGQWRIEGEEELKVYWVKKS